MRRSRAPSWSNALTGWIVGPGGVHISRLPNLSAFMARVAARPAVQEAMKAEGLLK
jgi:glutathione S-transferase